MIRADFSGSAPLPYIRNCLAALIVSLATATSLGKQLAASQGKRAVKGSLVRMAAHAAAGVATGGAFTAVTVASAARTAQVANNARRAVVAARLAFVAIGGPTPRNPSPKGPEALPPSPRGGGRALPAAPPTPSRGGFDEVDAAGQTVLVPSRRHATSGGVSTSHHSAGPAGGVAVQ